jgi:hypothetical protein
VVYAAALFTLAAAGILISRLNRVPKLTDRDRPRGLFGNHAAAALTLSKGREAEYGAAFAFALAGYSSPSLQLANNLEKRFPEDTSVHSLCREIWPKRRLPTRISSPSGADADVPVLKQAKAGSAALR